MIGDRLKNFEHYSEDVAAMPRWWTVGLARWV